MDSTMLSATASRPKREGQKEPAGGAGGKWWKRLNRLDKVPLIRLWVEDRSA